MTSLLLESALRALLLAVAVWAGLRVLRVRDVLAQKCAWAVVLYASFAMPLLLPLTAHWPGWTAATVAIPALAPRPAMAPVAAADRADAVAAPALAETRNAAAPGERLSTAEPAALDRFPAPTLSQDDSAVAAAPASQPATVPPPFTLAALAWLVYLTVAGALLSRLLYGLAAAFRLWRKAEPVSSDVSRLAAGLRLRASGAVSSPVSIGSSVVLPAGYVAWDDEKLRIVLAHERSHVRQGDFYLQLLAGLYAALVWFSPLGWWLKRKLSDLGEAISDRSGLAEAASRCAYAQVLLEFAAAPRPAWIGVAMARPSSLSRRMERILNESAFRQAFAGGRRALLAALLAPVVLFAASALVHVQAATQPPPQTTAPAQAQAPVTGQSHPDNAPILAPDDAQTPPQNEPAPMPPPPAGAPAAAAPTAPAGLPAPNPAPAPEAMPAPPPPPEPIPMVVGDGTAILPPGGPGPITIRNYGGGYHYSYSYSYSGNPSGDSYALVTGKGGNVQFSGSWTKDQSSEIDMARKMANGGSFLWFRHEGKSYIVTDPATIERIEAMYRPMQELGKQQAALGLEQEALGKEQEAFGQAQKKAGQVAPDLSKQMAKLKTDLAELQAQISRDVTQANLDVLSARLAEVQARIGALQGEMGARQGEFGRQQGQFGAEQGRLGAEQGRLGAAQGRLAREADRQVRAIIEESLKNGQAQPVK